jgi:tetratricopeptide (TPR) repeat protein
LKNDMALTSGVFSKAVLAGLLTVGMAWHMGVDPIPEAVTDLLATDLRLPSIPAKSDPDDESVLMGGLARVAEVVGIRMPEEMSRGDEAAIDYSGSASRLPRRQSARLRSRLAASERRSASARRSLSTVQSRVVTLESQNTSLEESVFSMQRELNSSAEEMRRLRLALARSAEASAESRDGLLDAAEAELREARFEGALELMEEARRMLATSRGDARVAQRAARLETAHAVAQVALGQTDAAVTSFERALRADPGLKLDASTSSPKLLRAFEAAKAAAD